MVDEEHPQGGQTEESSQQPAIEESSSLPGNTRNSDTNSDNLENESLDTEVPRFITASNRFEHYLLSLSFPDETAERRVEIYDKLLRSSDSLHSLAQRFEFMGMIPDLADTDARHYAGRQLATELQNPELPEGVRAIYSELYGQDVAAYTGPVN